MTTNTKTLDQQIDSARAKLAELQGVAEDAEAEAARWATTFQRDPSEEAFSRKAVTAQQAKNARAAAVAFERETLEALLNQKRQSERDAIGRALKAREDAVRARFADAVGQLAGSLRELDGAIADLTELHGPRLDAQRAGVPLFPLSLADIISELSGRLSEFDGRTAHELQHTGASIKFDRFSPTPTVIIHVQRPAVSVPTPLR